MGKIDKFLAKPVEVTLGGETLKLNPFTVDDTPTLNKMSSKDPETSGEGIKEAIFKIFKQIDPDCTMEQVSNISIEYLEEISDVIGEINNIDVDEAKERLLKEHGSNKKS